MSISESISTRYIVSFSHTETLNLYILSIIGRVGIKLELPFSSQVSFCPRLDRFQAPCLPNNLPGEESDQPRQKTRLTVPDCAVKEIRSLTEWSYSISCLTDGGRWLHRETKTEGVKKKEKRKWVPEGIFKQSLPVWLWSQRRLRRPLWLAEPQASADRFVINLAQAGGERREWPFITCATQNKAWLWQRSLNGCFWVVTQVVAKVSCSGRGVFQVSQWQQSAWWMVEHNEWALPGRSSLMFKD